MGRPPPPPGPVCPGGWSDGAEPGLAHGVRYPHQAGQNPSPPPSIHPHDRNKSLWDLLWGIRESLWGVLRDSLWEFFLLPSCGLLGPLRVVEHAPAQHKTEVATTCRAERMLCGDVKYRRKSSWVRCNPLWSSSRLDTAVCGESPGGGY